MKALNEDVSTANLNATPAAMKIVAKTGQNSVHKNLFLFLIAFSVKLGFTVM